MWAAVKHKVESGSIKLNELMCQNHTFILEDGNKAACSLQVQYLISLEFILNEKSMRQSLTGVFDATLEQNRSANKHSSTVSLFNRICSG